MQLGLLGKSLKHSFSKAYFAQKFLTLGVTSTYENHEVAKPDDIGAWLETCNLDGFNVTFPYKVDILSLLHRVSPVAEAVGAVNTVKRVGTEWWGHNTDVDGVNLSLDLLLGLEKQSVKAAVLGNGGAAMAVREVLKRRGWDYAIVSRNPFSMASELQISYDELNDTIADYTLIINSTPVGTWPDVSVLPPIVASKINREQYVWDLIYNPPATALLKQAEQNGAKVLNGIHMLHAQAEAAWRVWTGVNNPWA